MVDLNALFISVVGIIELLFIFSKWNEPRSYAKWIVEYLLFQVWPVWRCMISRFHGYSMSKCYSPIRFYAFIHLFVYTNMSKMRHIFIHNARNMKDAQRFKINGSFFHVWYRNMVSASCKPMHVFVAWIQMQTLMANICAYLWMKFTQCPRCKVQRRRQNKIQCYAFHLVRTYMYVCIHIHLRQFTWVE